MERDPSRTSLAAFFIATAAVAVALACWVNYPNGNWNIVVTAAAIAFITAIITPLRLMGGLAAGLVAVLVACIVIEKDPSGLGPFELIFPIQLGVSLVPIVTTAALGRCLRLWLSGSSRVETSR